MSVEIEHIETFLNDIKRRGQHYLLKQEAGSQAVDNQPNPAQTVAQSEAHTTINENSDNTASIAMEAKKLETSSLNEIRNDLGDCQRCQLHSTRNNIVFGVGHENADFMIVGEAPGRDEDNSGEPFVGRAGKLLTKIVEAIGLRREEIYIANIIKCRPPENRNPEPDEIEQCEPFLIKQIQSIQPKVICCVGKFAAQTLLKTEMPISKLRGQFAEYEGIPLMPTYHPAYLLRNPSAKKFVWEDMQLIHAKLCELTGKNYDIKKTQ